MPDSVRIGIESSYSGAGVNNALSDMQRLDGAGKSLSGTMFHAEGVMRGWSQAQYVASYNTERLASRASFLEEQVKKGKITTQQATEAWKGYTAEARRAEFQAMTFGEKYAYTSKIINDKAGAFLSGAAKFTGMAVAIGYAGKQVYDFARSGAEIEYTTQRFDRLARSVGSTGDVFLTQLRSATRGTVSDFGLLKQGSDLLQLGLASDTKEAVRLSSVMTALGMDTGELTLALANQSKRRLDQLGLSLTKFNEIEGKLKGSGMSKQDAFKEAFMQTAEQTVMVTGNKADSPIGDFQRLEAGWANIVNSAKEFVAQDMQPLVNDASNIFQAINAVKSGEMAWGGNMLEIMSGSKPALISGEQNLSNLAMQQWQRNNTTTTRTGRGEFTSTPPVSLFPASDFLYEDAASRNARLRPNGPGGGGPAGEGATVDYAALLQGGLDLTRMTDAFTAKTADLNSKLREENEVLAELTDKYGEGSDKLLEQQDKIASLKGDISSLGMAMQDSSEQFALGMLQSKDATEQQQVAFARAAGMITQDAENTYNAQAKLAEAYTSGQISAESYASGVSQVAEMVAGLDGMKANVTIDVWIKEHGSIPIVSRRPTVCFVAGTLIAMADGAQKPIEAVEVGDVVKAYDTEKGEFVSGIVSQTFQHEADGYYDIDGLLVTGEHPIFLVTRGEFVPAKDIHIGDIVMTVAGGTKVIKSKGYIFEAVTVYNLEVEAVHTYFANGILVHNKMASNAWTGGPLNGDGFTVVGDAPGGVWTPHTEVIYNGHVFNAEEARALKDAGLLEGAAYAAGGTAGQGPARRNARRSGGGPPGGSRSVRTGGDRHGGTLGSGSFTNGDATAADVADQISNSTAAVVVSSQQATQENAQLQTQQQVDAQQQTQQVLAEKLDQVVAVLKKQADKNDMYTLFHSGQQTSI